MRVGNRVRLIKDIAGITSASPVGRNGDEGILILDTELGERDLRLWYVLFSDQYEVVVIERDMKLVK